MFSGFPQMLAFKNADLEMVQHQDLSAYTSSPAHNLKSVSASTKRFLNRTANRTPPPIQPADTTACPPPHASAGGHDMVVDGLQYELDSYLYEPPMAPFKEVPQDSGAGNHVVCCDPLRYWMV